MVNYLQCFLVLKIDLKRNGIVGKKDSIFFICSGKEKQFMKINRKKYVFAKLIR